MPFDIGFDTDPKNRRFLSFDNDGSEFVPDFHHIRHDIMLLSDGAILGMIKLPGLPFELEGMQARNIQRRQLIDLIRSNYDDNVTLHFSLVNHRHEAPFRYGKFRSRYAERVLRRYEKQCLSNRLMHKEWYITVIVSPRFVLGTWVKQHLGQVRKRPKPKASPVMIQQLDNILARWLNYLAPYGARRLGLRRSEINGRRCSEIIEARRLILYGQWQEIPLTTETAGRSIYNERIKCGTKFTRIEHPGGPRWAKTLSIFDYPAGELDEDGKVTGGTFTGQFSRFLQMRENFPFVASQSFRILSRGSADTGLYLKSVRMQNTSSIESRQLKGIRAAREALQGGETVRGEHNFSFTVFGDTPSDAAYAAEIASGAMVDAGVIPIVDDGNSFSAFWLGLPGQVHWLKCRSGKISNENITAFAPIEGFPTGDERGHWGDAIIRFASLGHTGYDWQPFVGDIGHALFLGRSTSGKTFLMNLLACALEQYSGTVVLLDKDEGSRPFVHATGGTYFTLRAGEASGLAPLRALSNTPANHAFLTEWIGKLITSDELGPLQTVTLELLQRAVARQLRLPPHKRSLAGVRAFLGFGAGYDGDRLQRWCRGGDRGHIFDNERDEISLDTCLIGIDLTQYLDHAACPYIGAYLIHRIRELIDGRRITVIADEVKAYLLNDLFADLIDDFSLRLRKLNGELWLLAQAPEHITQSKCGLALAQQAQTIWVFPQRNASEAEFCGKLNFSVPMFKALTEKMPTLGHRSVLMYRENSSAIFDIQMRGMDDDIMVLSGRKETNNYIPEILAEIGDDYDRFADLFIAKARAHYARVQQRELVQ